MAPSTTPPLFRLAGLLAVLGLLVACEPTPAPLAPAHVRFAVPNVYGFDRAFYEDALARFRGRYPQVTVTLLPDVPLHALADRVAAGDVDAFLAVPSITGMPDAGLVRSLAPLMETDPAFDRDDVYPGLWAPFTRQGAVWALPAGATPLVAYYNRELFDAHGVPYPAPGWTWDDFERTARALYAPEAGVVGFTRLSTMAEVLPIVYQHGGRVLDDWYAPTRPTFDAPRTVEALAWYGAQASASGSSAAEGAEGERFYAGVAAGRVGMWMDAWMDRELAGRMRPGWPPAWAMAPLPRDAQVATQGVVAGYAIAAGAPAPEAAWRWITFLSAQTPPGMAPARRSIATSAAYAERVGDDVAAVAQAALEGQVLVYALDPAWQAVMRPFWDAAAAVVVGAQDAPAALEAAQAHAETLVP
jgi:multiple sugar transport system substrate-binding protein